RYSPPLATVGRRWRLPSSSTGATAGREYCASARWSWVTAPPTAPMPPTRSERTNMATLTPIRAFVTVPAAPAVEPPKAERGRGPRAVELGPRGAHGAHAPAEERADEQGDVDADQGLRDRARRSGGGAAEGRAGPAHGAPALGDAVGALEPDGRVDAAVGAD